MRPLAVFALTLALSLSLPVGAQAATLSGVTVADSTSVAGKDLVLNGVGARKKYMFTVYVGALYMPSKTTDARTAITTDVPKKLVMHFVYSGGVTKKQLVDSYEEGLAKQPDAAAVRERWATVYGWLSDVGSGDEIVFEYVPGTGTTVTVKGQRKGVVPGKDFMTSLMTVYLGSNPPTGALKSGMLGG